MGLFDQLNKRRFAPAKQDVLEAPPTGGFKRFWFLFATHFGKLISLNLLFLAFCVPIITIPAALCGMNRVLIKLVRDGNCYLWSDFIGEFKLSFWKSMPFGALCAFLALDAFFALTMSAEDPAFSMLLTAAGLLLYAAAALFSGYVFVFIPTLSLKNKHIARNAFILMMSEWKTDLVLLGVAFAAVFVGAGLFPFGIIALILFWFALSQLAVCVAVNEPLQRRIIGPYEENKDSSRP